MYSTEVVGGWSEKWEGLEKDSWNPNVLDEPEDIFQLDGDEGEISTSTSGSIMRSPSMPIAIAAKSKGRGREAADNSFSDDWDDLRERREDRVENEETEDMHFSGLEDDDILGDVNAATAVIDINCSREEFSKPREREREAVLVPAALRTSVSHAAGFKPPHVLAREMRKNSFCSKPQTGRERHFSVA